MAVDENKQNVLSVELDGENIVSREFDYECMCLINDEYNNNVRRDGTSISGELRLCDKAVKRMFAGTKVTDEVLKNMPLAKRAALAYGCWDIYLAVVKEANRLLKN